MTNDSGPSCPTWQLCEGQEKDDCGRSKQAGLGLAIPLFECGDGLLMEEELEPLLGVVVAQFLKRGSGRPEKIIK